MAVGSISLECVKEDWNRDLSSGIFFKEIVFKVMRLDENNIQSNVDKCKFTNREIIKWKKKESNRKIRSKDWYLEVGMVGDANKRIW